MMQQRNEEWFRARLGCVTASRICDVMATLKATGEAKVRANYRAEKVLERISGTPQERNYINGAMQVGIEHEAKARALYEFLNNCPVDEVGFWPHPDIPYSGASPDGLVGEDGCLEIKCPEPRAYLDAKLGKAIDRAYLDQMQWQMACTGRQWCDYLVYREGLPLVRIRINRDNKRIAELETEVRKFLAEVADELEAATHGERP